MWILILSNLVVGFFKKYLFHARVSNQVWSIFAPFWLQKIKMKVLWKIYKKKNRKIFTKNCHFATNTQNNSARSALSDSPNWFKHYKEQVGWAAKYQLENQEICNFAKLIYLSRLCTKTKQFLTSFNLQIKSLFTYSLQIVFARYFCYNQRNFNRLLCIMVVNGKMFYFSTLVLNMLHNVSFPF